MKLRLKQIDTNGVLGAVPVQSSTGLVWSDTTNQKISANGILSSDGATSPSISFSSDTDTGLYRVGPAKLGFATSGALRFFVNTVSVTSYMPLRLQKTTNPSLTFDGDTDTGLGSTADNSVGLYTNGVERFTLTDTIGTFTLTSAIKVATGTTAERPATPSNGMMRYNTTSGRFEFYENGSWVSYSTTSGSTSITLTGDVTGSGTVTRRSIDNNYNSV